MGSCAFTQASSGWTAQARERGIFFDLSRVEWVELEAVVQLVLLIESALKNDISVSVALPQSEARKSEKAWMKDNPNFAHRVQQRIKKRKAVLNFLTHLQFQNALKPIHLESKLSCLNLLTDFDPSRTEEEEDICLEEEQEQEKNDALPAPEPFYNFCFPLNWISIDDQPTKIKQLSKFIAHVASSTDTTHHGIEVIDADTIANVILYELVSNVANHAGDNTSHALVAASLRPSHMHLKPKFHITAVHPYIQWLNEKQTSLVEIVIGDSGKGIKKTLEENYYKARPPKKENKGEIKETVSIMQWAFDRWSTSRKKSKLLRGTRGLYRIDRIVKKYQGIVTLRSENVMVGIDHGGPYYDECISSQSPSPQKLSFIPGTILKFWLPPFRERIIKRQLETEPTSEIIFENIELGDISENGIEPSLRDLLEKKLSNDKVLILANVTGGVETHEAVYETLRQAVEMRHPGSLVLSGLPGGNDLIESAVNSLNKEHEKNYRECESHRSEHFEIWDPVPIITSSNDIIWVGSTSTRRKVLNRLVEEGGTLQAEAFKKLIPDKKERSRILLEFRNDTSVIKIHDDGAIEWTATETKLLYKLAAVSPNLHQCLYKFIKKSLKQHVLENKAGVYAEGIYRSPSLHLMKKWINVGKIIENVTDGPHWTMYALSKLVKDFYEEKGIFPADFIIYDSSSRVDNINHLQEWLEIEYGRKEVIAGDKGVHIYNKRKLIPDASRVLIYSDQIISNKSVVRCLQQILRDDTIPIVVACLFDLREKSQMEIEVWGKKLPVVSLVKIPLVIDDSTLEKIPININPITRKEEKYQVPFSGKRPYEITESDMEELLIKHKAIHFSHVGRPIGRHFTFYLGSTALIEDDKISDAFNSEIDSWLEGKKLLPRESQKLEIWYPESEPQPFAPAYFFATKLGGLRDDVVHLRQIPREAVYRQWLFSEKQEFSIPLKSKSIAVVDWGALTGDTVTQMIRLAVEAGVEHILICIFLSQLSQTEESFLRLLDRTKIASQPDPKSKQLKLWSKPNNPEKPDTLEIFKYVTVSVKFLGRFPIKAYSGEHECPVCQGLPSMAKDDYPTDFLWNYAKKMNHKKFQTRTREEIVYSSKKDFLSEEVAIFMAKFREDLVSSLIFTNKRQEVYEKIKEFHKSINGSSIYTNDEIVSFITFLSIERQWLSNPPLYFLKVRRLIAEIALSITEKRETQTDNRLAALIVLRASSKTLFAKKFSTLFDSVIGSEEILVQQLMYGAFTYISRPYHKTEEIFQPLRESLCKTKSIYIGDSHSPEIVETIDILIARIEQKLSIAGVRTYSDSLAWSKLNDIFHPGKYHNHLEVPKSIVLMKPGHPERDDIEENIDILRRTHVTPELQNTTIQWLELIGNYWDNCCSFLDNTLLPILFKIRPLLLTEIGAIRIGQENLPKLLKLIDEANLKNKPLSESGFSKLVHEISKNPSTILSEEKWHYYLKKVEWFEAVLLRPLEKRPLENDIKKSNLIDFLRQSPAQLGEIVEQQYKAYKTKLPINHTFVGPDKLLSNDLSVFFPKEWTHNLIRELLENIGKRIDPPNASIAINVSIEQDNGYVKLVICNNYTNPDLGIGSQIGLTTFKRRLQIFNGDLSRSWERDTDKSKSIFRIEITFLRGE